MPDSRLTKTNRRSKHYPRFSEEEYERRWRTMREFMDAHDLDTIILYGNSELRKGGQTNIQYLSNYAGDFMTYLVLFSDPVEDPTLYGGLSNHLQYMAEVSTIDDIRLMLPDPPEKIANRIEEADLLGGRTGIISLDPRYGYDLPNEHQNSLEELLDGEIINVTREFTTQVHAIKSDEEIEWIRKGAEYTDKGMEALVDAIEPGVTENELIAEYKYAFEKEGGESSWNFINSAPMNGAEQGEAVTWKEPSSRSVESGDIISTELSASHHGYAGQLHRPITVDSKPTDEYLNMWEIAVETYEQLIDALEPGNTAQDLANAVEPIEKSKYKIYDVLVHGFGNAYIHPFIGTKDSNYWPGGEDPITEDWELKEGMCLVIQPNLLNEKETKGFQLGTTAVITSHGADVLHDYPVEFIQT